jgi:hypothetical protein
MNIKLIKIDNKNQMKIKLRLMIMITTFFALNFDKKLAVE